MENLNALLIIIVVSLAVGAALYEAFLQLTGRLVTKPPKVNWRKNWAGALETLGPVKIHPLDSWVRDGSVPLRNGLSHRSIRVFVALGESRGYGIWDYAEEHWEVLFFDCKDNVIVKVDAWQKFPEYEKI